MYHEFFPYIRCWMSAVPFIMDYLESPPVWWYTVAADINTSSSSSVEGKYERAHGRLRGIESFNEADTFKQGTSGRTGIACTTELGTWRDDWVVPETGKYALLFDNGKSGETFQATTESISTNRLRVYLHRGSPAHTVTRDDENIYAYLYFNIGSSKGEYRLKFEWQTPPSLEYLDSRSIVWKTVAVASSLGSSADLFRKNNNRVEIDYEQSSSSGFVGVTITIAGSVPLRHSPPASVHGAPELPDVVKVRLEGKNGWAGLEVMKPSGGSLAVQTSLNSLPSHPNVSLANVVTNQRGDNKQEQVSTQSSVSQDPDGKLNLSVSMQSETTNPSLVDVLVYIPPVWSFGIGSIYYGELKVIFVQEEERWDDINHFGSSKVSITFSNSDGEYSHWRGHMACVLEAGNGYVYTRRHFGIAGGDGWNFSVSANVSDKGHVTSEDCLSHKAHVPLGQEVVLDGLSARKAVRELLQMMSVSPRFMNYIPDDGFPPYSDSFQGYILPSGTGLSPRMRYMPQHSCLGVILDVVKETGKVIYDSFGKPVSSIPYYLWQDVYGQVHFEPWHPLWYPPANIYYTEYDSGSGYNNVQSFEFSSSIENLRTDITVQGQDLWTYELLNAYVPLPRNRLLTGYYYPLVERNQRYSSLSYMETAVRNIAVQASLETQFCTWTVPFNPEMSVGMVALIQNNRYLGGVQPYVIIQHNAQYGIDQNGKSVGVSRFVGRALSNYLIM